MKSTGESYLSFKSMNPMKMAYNKILVGGLEHE
jgi:hypothetical protein